MLDKLDIPHLQDIIRACPVGVLLQDNSGRISWINDTLADMLGPTRQNQLLNQQVDELPEPLGALFNLTTPLHLPNQETGDDRWLMREQQIMPDNQGTVHYFIDITPLQRLMQERDQLKDDLNDIIMVDSETGMRNRKGLYYSLEPQLSRSRRYDRPLSIIILRLNCLERFTQDYQRDDALPIVLAVSRLLSDQLRWADLAGRLSENDFLLVLPETRLDDANKVADNLRRQITELTLPDPVSADFMITAQFGVAEWRKGDDMGLLLMRARKMLNDDAEPQPENRG
ncbi:sensor domain-containing diguanylate cyclase [Thiohalophilus thiocyanatoxydans]|uniref:diguanylate cyclase n=1 Tax=Thiohalophilus thiocyanatoxydans TaxID=381308 RepID=A0A4V3H4M2_9GAMM|nr:diguanylate cyclase [Thiohalophilus thiocyanatoxydans]TDY03735.1 diguanylate cyclase (GGDEF)-like protein [Thiohalophilus thiocyanatoxydans]